MNRSNKHKLKLRDDRRGNTVPVGVTTNPLWNVVLQPKCSCLYMFKAIRQITNKTKHKTESVSAKEMISCKLEYHLILIN